MEDSLSTIDSILSPTGNAKWEKLDDTEVLVQLLRKFCVDGGHEKLLNVHEDEGAEEGEDDVIGSDCYFLDTGFPALLGCTKLWGPLTGLE